MKKTEPTTAQRRARDWLEGSLIDYSRMRDIFDALPDYDELSPLLRAGKWQEVLDAFEFALPQENEDDAFSIRELVESIGFAVRTLIDLNATGETFADIRYESE